MTRGSSCARSATRISSTPSRSRWRTRGKAASLQRSATGAGRGERKLLHRHPGLRPGLVVQAVVTEVVVALDGDGAGTPSARSTAHRRSATSRPITSTAARHSPTRIRPITGTEQTALGGVAGEAVRLLEQAGRPRTVLATRSRAANAGAAIPSHSNHPRRGPCSATSATRRRGSRSARRADPELASRLSQSGPYPIPRTRRPFSARPRSRYRLRPSIMTRGGCILLASLSASGDRYSCHSVMTQSADAPSTVS